MINMKCPFCQQELHKDSDGYYTCYTDNCECMKYGGNGVSGSESLWLALIYTRNELYVEKKENENKQAILNSAIDMLKTLNKRHFLVAGKNVIKEMIRLSELTKGDDNER